MPMIAIAGADDSNRACRWKSVRPSAVGQPRHHVKVGSDCGSVDQRRAPRPPRSRIPTRFGHLGEIVVETGGSGSKLQQRIGMWQPDVSAAANHGEIDLGFGLLAAPNRACWREKPFNRSTRAAVRCAPRTSSICGRDSVPRVQRGSTISRFGMYWAAASVHSRSSSAGTDVNAWTTAAFSSAGLVTRTQLSPAGTRSGRCGSQGLTVGGGRQLPRLEPGRPTEGDDGGNVAGDGDELDVGQIGECIVHAVVPLLRDRRGVGRDPVDGIVSHDGRGEVVGQKPRDRRWCGPRRQRVYRGHGPQGSRGHPTSLRPGPPGARAAERLPRLLLRIGKIGPHLHAGHRIAPMLKTRRRQRPARTGPRCLCTGSRRPTTERT